jgi:hypothetical protein
MFWRHRRLEIAIGRDYLPRMWVDTGGGVGALRVLQCGAEFDYQQLLIVFQEGGENNS